MSVFTWLGQIIRKTDSLANWDMNSNWMHMKKKNNKEKQPTQLTKYSLNKNNKNNIAHRNEAKCETPTSIQRTRTQQCCRFI